ncbi:MAG: glycosyltransferase family 1 protein [Candidatus Taylorbacteria bacterium]|nr:glycosyltransferase family 1 protein [Candidatus Taylorbacteria bacterium]
MLPLSKHNMKIGFYFECNMKSGGVYQYAVNMLAAFKENKKHDYIIFTLSPDFPFEDFKDSNWKIVPIGFKRIKNSEEGKSVNEEKSVAPTFRRKINLLIINLLRALRLYRVEIFLARLNSKKRALNFEGHGIDLMVYHGPSEMSYLSNIPSLVVVHELQHRFNRQFPEVWSLGQWEKREYLYKNVAKKATIVIVEIDQNKREFCEIYGRDENTVEVIRCAPPIYLTKNVSEEKKKEVALKHSLPPGFLFYPAQFWPHKNHRNLIEAVKILRDKGEIFHLVLPGSKQELWGEYEKVLQKIKDLKIENQIHLIGYADNDEMSALFALCSAMIIPSFMGRIQTPTIEAWFMDKPVLQSNVPGILDEVFDAALLFDPSNPEDIAEKIHSFSKDENLQKQLVLNGKKVLERWSFSNLSNKLNACIDRFDKKSAR